MRLSAHEIAIERGGRRILSGVSFEARAGQALLLVGPNGSGKSSLLRAVAGFLPLAAGTFALEGGAAEAGIGEQAHYLGHADALKSALTAGENLAFWADALGGDSARAAWIAALDRLGLAHVADFPARALSAGQKRRVALARLLVAPRPIWLLDEPTTALDAAAQRQFAVVMREHLAGGGLILAATHAPLGPRRRGAADPRRRCGDGGGGVRRAAWGLFLREWRIASRIGGGASVGAVFFLILVTIMPFAVGPDLALLARIGPAILWVAALLATLLGLDRLFQGDHDDGSLDVLVNAGLPLELTVLVKCAAHWAASAAPLAILSPLFGLMLGMDAGPLALVAVSLVAGTPALTMIGAIGAALTVSLRRGGLLMAVLVLPLAIPVLIFGVSAASAASGGASPLAAPLLMLCALSLAAIALAPFAAAAALRHVRD